MKTTLTVSIFVIAIVALIAGFASLIPQLESPAPEVLQISGDLSGSELAEVGRLVFESAEAGCLACHGLGRQGLRAPDLAGIGGRATDRVPGKSAEEYIRESLVNPCAYAVDGYDCIMPQTLQQTLGPAKIEALIAFLQSQGGEITVELSAEEAAGGTAPSGGAAGVAGTTAQDIVTNAGCVACHRIDAVGATGQVGPNLSQVGARIAPEEIRQSILTPDATIAEQCPTGACPAGVMPKDFGTRLNAMQLETLVAFLSDLK